MPGKATLPLLPVALTVLDLDAVFTNPGHIWEHEVGKCILDRGSTDPTCTGTISEAGRHLVFASYLKEASKPVVCSLLDSRPPQHNFYELRGTQFQKLMYI